MPVTDTKTDEQYELAQKMTADYGRVLDLCAAVQERNNSSNEPWDDEMIERIIDEHIGDPLDIEWAGTCRGNPAYGDAEWEVEEVRVLLGTGGPARGINFRNGNAYCWHQDWFTPRVEDIHPLSNAEVLASRWGLEDY